MNRLDHFCTRCGKALKKTAKEITFQSGDFEITYTICSKCKQVNVVEVWATEARQLSSRVEELRTYVVDENTSSEGRAVIAETILKLNENIRRITQYDMASMKSVNIAAQNHNEIRTRKGVK